MKLKISFPNQLKMLTHLIFISIVYFLLMFFGWYTFEFKLKIFLLIPYVFMFFIPVVIIHLNYLNENQGIIFKINPNMIVKQKGTEIKEYTNEEIKKITFYMNGSKDTGNGTLAFSKYYYAKIELQNGSHFIITSLYSSKIDKILEENFKDVKITVEKVFYPMI